MLVLNIDLFLSQKALKPTKLYDQVMARFNINFCGPPRTNDTKHITTVVLNVMCHMYI